MPGAETFRASADAYDRHVGRYGSQLAFALIEFAGVEPGIRVFPDGRERQTWPGITYIRTRPMWIRYSDFNHDPPEIRRARPRGAQWLGPTACPGRFSIEVRQRHNRGRTYGAKH